MPANVENTWHCAKMITFKIHRLMQAAKRLGGAIGLLVVVCSSVYSETASSPLLDMTEVIERLSLRSIDGVSLQMPVQDSRQLTVFCFLGTECPLAKLYGPRLQALAEEFQPHGVRFIGISSNVQDSAEEVQTYVSDCGIKFPVCKDYNNVVADLFSANRTPEVFVTDASHRLRYRGRIDDQYSPGTARSQPTRHDLRLAVEQLLAGRDVTRPHIDAVGCLIGRIKRPVSDSNVTYANQVARVLQKNCVECHREDQIGPFSLTNYDEVIGWGEMMVEVIDEQRMPPWHANPDHGEFANARFMPDSEKQLIRDWVDAGMPYGDEADLPEPIEFTDGWRLPREPDVVIEMREKPFSVPAEGTIEYQYFVVDPGFEEDKWVTAAEVLPGNRSVVHHSIVFIRPPDGSRFRGVNWLTAYVPGQANPTYSPTRARRIPAGSKLVFQQHYTPNGTPQSDLSKIGILFGDPKVITHEAYTLIGIDQEFVIPPRDSDFKVSSKLSWIPDNAELLAVAPHMHLRGKSFRLFAESDARKDVLLDVPKYDFNWQHVYEFKDPIPLANLKELEFDVVFDNSKENPVNPNPDEHVCWGDQTWEEMAVAFFEVAEPIKKPQPTLQDSKVDVDVHPPAISADRQKRIDEFVDKFFARFDKNEDGLVSKVETSFAFQKFSFHLFNADNDDLLSRDEITDAAKSRIQ